VIADLISQLGTLSLCAAPAAILVTVLCAAEAVREFIEERRAIQTEQNAVERIARNTRLGRRIRE
jgi:hypothetical protein